MATQAVTWCRHQTQLISWPLLSPVHCHAQDVPLQKLKAVKSQRIDDLNLFVAEGELFKFFRNTTMLLVAPWRSMFMSMSVNFEVFTNKYCINDNCIISHPHLRALLSPEAMCLCTLGVVTYIDSLLFSRTLYINFLVTITLKDYYVYTTSNLYQNSRQQTQGINRLFFSFLAFVSILGNVPFINL